MIGGRPGAARGLWPPADRGAGAVLGAVVAGAGVAGAAGVSGAEVRALATVCGARGTGCAAVVWVAEDAQAAALELASSRTARQIVRCACSGKGTWWESNPHTGAEDPLGANPARSHVATPGAGWAPAPVRRAAI